MKNKYFNNAIIGNKNMVASFSDKGELLRLYYPQTDFKQFIDFMYVGMKINDSGMIYFHSDINNLYEQKYEKNTNIVNTNIYNTYFKIKVAQKDFITIKEDVLIRKYVFENENNIELNVSMLIHSKLLNTTNNKVSGIFRDNVLMQYTHDYTVGYISKTPASSFQINGTSENIDSGVIGGKDYIGMSEDSSISYNLGTLKPGEKKEINVMIFISANRQCNLIDNIEKIKKIDVKSEYENTKKFWKKYLRFHSKIEIEEKNPYTKKILQIYNRSILLFPLLTNYNTGGISAAIEVDEGFEKCGRYNYCWPRDAVFITNALDKIGMEKETQKFYQNFCKMTQSKNGVWEQRFFTDGKLAPCWGYQIDETASVVYGVYKHYENTKNQAFLKSCFKMCEKAVRFLENYLDNIFSNKQIVASYDIWEMNEGIHLYSLASIYGAFQAMINIYNIEKPKFEEENNRLKLEQIIKHNEKLEDYLRKIKEYIINNFYDESKKSFIRHKDGKMDISILGLVYPFNLFNANEKKMENTVQKMEMTLRTYTGGYLRFEEDNYGGNPWVISNLWLANYYLNKGEKKKAEECLGFVVKSATEHGFLPEQVDNKTMKPAWVIGLGWSHAMFVTTLNRLMNDN